MALPAMASEITLAKNVTPNLPNIYRIGDTIHYVLFVGNPPTNPATNTMTDIHDTLPNGTDVQLNVGNVILPPGGNVTYNLDYVVAAADLVTLPSGQLGVKNQLHAIGFDSLGDGVDSTTNKQSVVIQPAIDLEKLVNGQDADSPTGPVVPVGSTVTFDFFVENCGNVALTNVVVTDDVYGNIGTIPTLAVGGNQTLTIQRTALAGQHTNMGNVTTDQGVTDEDAGNYFGEEAAGCTLTWGYWKTHSYHGPAAHPNDTWNLIQPSGVDSPFFISGQTYYEVLQTTPRGGNVYYQLAHQYIAAKLNILNGASSPAEVDAAIAWAENFFNTYLPNDTLPAAVKSQAGAYASLLDNYNEGIIGPGHCPE